MAAPRCLGEVGQSPVTPTGSQAWLSSVHTLGRREQVQAGQGPQLGEAEASSCCVDLTACCIPRQVLGLEPGSAGGEWLSGDRVNPARRSADPEALSS